MQKMRRENQLLSEKDTIAVLERGTNGVLAIQGIDGYPYAVPLSYVYCEDKIYFHGAKVGHKIEAIQKSGKASFCVVDKDEIVSKEYTTYFRSVIAFGEVRILEDEFEKREALKKLAMKYSADMGEEAFEKVMEKSFQAVAIIEFSIAYMTGKEAIELVK